MAKSKRTTSRTTTRRQSNGGSALRLLKDDHARVKRMFSEFEKADAAREKESLAARICNELTLHAELEETIFYPAVRAAIEDQEVMNEADVEHEGAKALIAKIQDSTASDDHYDAMVTVLGEVIKHHVKEEEGEMFEQVRRAKLDLDEIAERMEEFKRANAQHVGD